jgi:hypothetical protein
MILHLKRLHFLSQQLLLRLTLSQCKGAVKTSCRRSLCTSIYPRPRKIYGLQHCFCAQLFYDYFFFLEAFALGLNCRQRSIQ